MGKIIFILCTVQAMGLLKGLFASILRKDPIMFFMSMYGVFYMTSLLPGKYFAMATINKKAWGTSGRKTLLKNYNSLIPLVCWFCILFPGLVYTVVKEILNHQENSTPVMRHDFATRFLPQGVLYATEMFLKTFAIYMSTLCPILLSPIICRM